MVPPNQDLDLDKYLFTTCLQPCREPLTTDFELTIAETHHGTKYPPHKGQISFAKYFFRFSKCERNKKEILLTVLQVSECLLDMKFYYKKEKSFFSVTFRMWKWTQLNLQLILLVILPLILA